jgi:HK97 family phage prohead protease
MSAQPDTNELSDTGLLHRTFAAELTPGDGRTIDVRIVPYGERITHNDGLGGLPKGVAYQEEWEPGAFDDQIRGAQAGRAKHVFVNFEHRQGFTDIVGNGISLREEADGFHGSFELHDDPPGNKALLLVQRGILHGVSLEAVAKKSRRTADGVVKRVKAHLYGIALCREPAYANAKVLALREQADPIVFDEDLIPVALNPEVVERCRRLGIRLPQRYQAHPAEAGTPDLGTPDDGTRQDDTTSSLEEIENAHAE